MKIHVLEVFNHKAKSSFLQLKHCVAECFAEVNALSWNRIKRLLPEFADSYVQK